MYVPLKNGVLSETVDLTEPKKIKKSLLMGVPNRYRILKG